MHLDAVAYIHRSSPSVRGPAVSAGQRFIRRISRRSGESSSLRRPGIGGPYPCPMSADPGSIRADGHQALPNLAVQDASADPHIITAAARTGTDIELRIHTSVAPFDVTAEEWFPAAAGFAVTVIVHTVDAQTGAPRYLQSTEAAEWARAIFSTVDSAHGYFLRHRQPSTRAARIPPLPRHRPSGDSRSSAGDHLPALPTIGHRRQSRDHHSHDGLTRQAGPEAGPRSAGAASSAVRSARPPKGATLKSRPRCSLMQFLHPSRSDPPTAGRRCPTREDDALGRNRDG
ncbi:hypothetical protein SAMN04490220_1149 [Rhodococcus jostii]|uniref:Uncharacterized protein n=1 Tax=Rhodococcus jostii TaxID=132919 RepID=A0A1H4QXU4_RHOJO|nr:hypothetical protein SAMN04490220_1149 [Rhodococcus jostii]